MNNPFKKTQEPTELDDLIERLHRAMNNVDPAGEDYDQMMKQYTILKGIQATSVRKPLSKDALLNAGVSLASIVMIISFEHTHALTSKALGFVFKAKQSS